MAYMGQPVPSTVTSISQIKVSDGKSVDVTVPAKTGTVAGNFYVLDGFFGVVLKTIKAEDNTAGETVALQLEACEYVTDQIDTKQTFAKAQTSTLIRKTKYSPIRRSRAISSARSRSRKTQQIPFSLSATSR